MGRSCERGVCEDMVRGELDLPDHNSLRDSLSNSPKLDNESGARART